VYVQHDAHELNRQLLDIIDRSLKGTSQENLISDTFQGKSLARNLCLECAKCSTREETFLDCIVNVQNVTELSEGLRTNVKPEFLVEGNRYFCENCKKKTDAKRSMAYSSLPPVLTVALQRLIWLSAIPPAPAHRPQPTWLCTPSPFWLYKAVHTPPLPFDRPSPTHSTFFVFHGLGIPPFAIDYDPQRTEHSPHGPNPTL